ncbi:MAG: hypothetical protein A2Y62_20280 [Candidatus Fischerbacteria bacterium RBG_13_37_8]|uniref:Uncharacterized protein n=1 Tax=Candidatus Fischerbacteria bacterium RBG_13_37_8 TaxID=1817863 RepID=A0A1F5VFQ5_9BACT|nr:MAG: hypothetical protein A2Y62_20280 [Candidatus Fischerbacteria bacterium RBG_13_37_8]
MNARYDKLFEYPDTVNFTITYYSNGSFTPPYKYINDAVTVRYEWFFRDPEWKRKLPAQEPLKSWILKHWE